MKVIPIDKFTKTEIDLQTMLIDHPHIVQVCEVWAFSLRAYWLPQSKLKMVQRNYCSCFGAQLLLHSILMVSSLVVLQ